MRQREIRGRKKRKIPKWQGVLTKAERKHLRGVGVTTRKAFIRMNEVHNTQRREKDALESCYWCRGIANKMGLPVANILYPYQAGNAYELTTVPETKPALDKIMDMPLIYLVVGVSTLAWLLAGILTYLKGW